MRPVGNHAPALYFTGFPSRCGLANKNIRIYTKVIGPHDIVLRGRSIPRTESSVLKIIFGGLLFDFMVFRLGIEGVMELGGLEIWE